MMSNTDQFTYNFSLHIIKGGTDPLKSVPPFTYV